MNPNNPVSDLMTTTLTSVQPNDSVSRVRSIFESNDFHHIPVVEHGEKLVGIISRADYHKIAYALSLNALGKLRGENEFSSIIAKDIMTPSPMCLEFDDSIGLAADIFLANKFHALPVLEDGRLAGIITVHDLLKHSFNSPVEKENDLVYEE